MNEGRGSQTSAASYLDGRLVRVGDAFATFRSHLGLASEQAARHCLQMDRAWSGEISQAARDRGGTRILQLIPGGTIQGAGFNGTIDGGLSAPIHLDARSESGEMQITKLPWIYVYGHADDGSPFFMEEAGIRLVGKQNTRVVIQVGGGYAILQEAFPVGQPGREPEGEGARVECWVMPLEGGGVEGPQVNQIANNNRPTGIAAGVGKLASS
ncbi:hypothetical protein BDV39DRAFT_205415 [Aspergillus sergii]|uniref:Uncharacterized protein n=1 Tax=Aspergillus sergii TaxID=1034303 RepID=A0A5N6X268_9EURO|nr:hypothetical protein BDV39DRAFT_205415 [Aspergillus sergii]